MPDRSPNSPLTSFHQEAPASPGLLAPKPPPFQRLANFCLDLLFPPRCAGCGRIDAFWCEQCELDLETMPLLENVRQLPGLAGITSTAPHKGIIREAVQGLKYENARPVAIPLGQRLSRQLQAQHWMIDMIAPVPLHTSRLAERGYNQAQLLAEQVAHHMNIPCVPHALTRERNTQSQVTMSAQERLTNVAKAFSANPEIVANQRVLIIDDVYTTGATLNACGEALLEANAKAVYGLTVTAAQL